jgi:hypothetical protein
MAQMMLSSYDRLLRYCVGQGATVLTNNDINKRDLMMWLPSVSAQIEKFLNRSLHIESRTEYFDVDYERKEYYPKANPITTLTSVYSDAGGEWDGSEAEISDCYIGRDGNSVVLPNAEPFIAKKGLRIIYTGGLATTATRSVYAISGSAGTWTAGQYVFGGTSYAVGKVVSATATVLTADVLYGVFEAGEALTEYTTEAGATAGDATATLASVTTAALCESYPDIVTACEIQVRHMWANKTRLDVSSVSKDGGVQRIGAQWQSSVMGPPPPIVNDAYNLLMPYRRVVGLI